MVIVKKAIRRDKIKENLENQNQIKIPKNSRKKDETDDYIYIKQMKASEI
jgi:hypothetical protein